MVPRFTNLAEVYVSVIGRLRGEDALDGGDVQIQLETNTTDLSGTVIGENNILLESGTIE